MLNYIKADGFDEAIIEIGVQAMNDVAIYDYEMCVRILMKRDGMTYEEADEYMQFNVLNAYVGQNTPVFVWSDFDDETS